MELYTALVETERHVKAQFDDRQQLHNPKPNRPRIAAARQRLSLALHALARAIEPRQPATAGTAGLNR